MLLPKTATAGIATEGLKAAKLTAAQIKALGKTVGEAVTRYDPKQFLTFASAGKGATITKIPATAKDIDLMFLFVPRTGAGAGSLTLTLEVGEKVVGGNTFVLRPSAT